MAMKKIKPKYGKVVPPSVKEGDAILESDQAKSETQNETEEIAANNTEKLLTEKKSPDRKDDSGKKNQADEQIEKDSAPITANPNPFLQTKEVFNKANLTKIGYRMRTEYVEILDIIKKLKKGGYTLEAVLDDALTYYFENSEDGKEAIKKAEIFYS